MYVCESVDIYTCLYNYFVAFLMCMYSFLAALALAAVHGLSLAVVNGLLVASGFIKLFPPIPLF